MAVGSARAAQLEEAVDRGGFAPLSHRAERLLAGIGILLGVAVLALIALN